MATSLEKKSNNALLLLVLLLGGGGGSGGSSAEASNVNPRTLQKHLHKEPPPLHLTLCTLHLTPFTLSPKALHP